MNVFGIKFSPIVCWYPKSLFANKETTTIKVVVNLFNSQIKHFQYRTTIK